MRFVFASMALKSLLSFARVMTTLIAVFLQNSLTMVVNLKTSMDGSVRRQKTNRYLSKFHRLHPRPDYSFLGKLKGALLESALIEFFYRFFQHKIYYYFKQHRYNCDEGQFENNHICPFMFRSRNLHFYNHDSFT